MNRAEQTINWFKEGQKPNRLITLKEAGRLFQEGLDREMTKWATISLEEGDKLSSNDGKAI